MRLNFDLSEFSILRDNGTFRILWVAIPAVELYQEVFFVNFFEPWFLDFVHSDVHSDESFIDRRDVVESFLLQEIYFSYYLSFLFGWNYSHYPTKYFQRGLINHLEIHLVFMYASVSEFSLCYQITIDLNCFYPSKPLDSLIKLNNTSVIFFFSFSSWFLDVFDIEIIIIYFSRRPSHLKLRHHVSRFLFLIFLIYCDRFWSDSLHL